jgi:hypothetical protein
MPDRPTDVAMAKFELARKEANSAGFAVSGQQDAMARVYMANHALLMAEGMTQLAVALRATYILLEELKRSLA